MLAQGTSFRDWHIAQCFLKGEENKNGGCWFEVPFEVIDQKDQDCVWRRRIIRDQQGNAVNRRYTKEIFEMWSPVRWVALFVKLTTPNRTYQVRMLDSGEGDTDRFEILPDVGFQWVPNTNPVAKKVHQGRYTVRHGVFRKTISAQDGEGVTLFINTNKTADQKKSGDAKGFEQPLPFTADVSSNPYFWMAKLRDWQEKYNPIDAPMDWRDLPTSSIGMVKSEAQLLAHNDACFLFREPASEVGREFPLSDGMVSLAWYLLLGKLEADLESENLRTPAGNKIQLIQAPNGDSATPHFPLHSIRVSLITAWIIDAELPPEVVQAIVGHTRLVMTLYYTKISSVQRHLQMAKANDILESKKAAGIEEFLTNSDIEEIQKNGIFNSSDGILAAVAHERHQRNPAGWMPMHLGMCLVGGNTGPESAELNARVGGCYNGGRQVNPQGKHGPVEGGPRNCCRCRWLISSTDYLPNMVASQNMLFWKFHESGRKVADTGREVTRIETERENGAPGLDDVHWRADRLHESAVAEYREICFDMNATLKLVYRCLDVLRSKEDDSDSSLVLAGDQKDLQAAVGGVDSELLQLCGVCEDSEVHPDLDATKAVLKRSQLLDMALMREHASPIFIRLSEKDQHLVGNALIRRLALAANPSNAAEGYYQVITAMDAGLSLKDVLGIDIVAEIDQSSQGIGASKTMRQLVSESSSK